MSVGLPVFNGEPFLREAVQALLDQSFRNIEVIISDNASTDRTQEICEYFARTDERVRYIRQPENKGFFANFVAVFDLSKGPYFKWAAADDLHRPDFVLRCMEALESDPEVVLAYTRADSINSRRRVVRPGWGARPELTAEDADVRFRSAIAPSVDPIPLPIFGVFRRAVLKDRMMVPGPYWDKALLAEVALHGPFAEVDEPLFLQREHERRIGRPLAQDSRAAPELIPGASRLPHWALLRHHLASIRHRPTFLSARPLYGELAKWVGLHRRGLLWDLLLASANVPGLGRLAGQLARRSQRSAWFRRRRIAERELDRCLPGSARVVVVDDDAVGFETIGGRSCHPLVERDGVSWGFPEDSFLAISELEARRDEGATHLAVLWTGRWILDYHREFAAHVRRLYRLVSESDRAEVYDLRAAST